MFNFPSQANTNGTIQTLSISFGDCPQSEVVTLILFFQVNYEIFLAEHIP